MKQKIKVISKYLFLLLFLLECIVNLRVSQHPRADPFTSRDECLCPVKLVKRRILGCFDVKLFGLVLLLILLEKIT